MQDVTMYTLRKGQFENLLFRECKCEEAADSWFESNQFLNCLNSRFLFLCYHLEVGVKRKLASTGNSGNHGKGSL